MNKDKVVEIIKKRIEETKVEYAQHLKRCEESEGRMVCDSVWYEGKIRAYMETLEVIGMLDKENNK